MKPIYAILNFLLFYGSTQAQDILRPIKYLTTDNGLSQAINYSILKDSKELVWITSYDGLNKFDSRKITPYRNMLQDSTSFKGTLSMGLVEDENHNVWCGSNDELNVYIRNRNYFKHVNFNNTDNSLYIPLISYSNNILFKKGDNLFTCDINTYQIKKITVALPEELLKYTPKVFESNSSFYIFFLSKPLLSSSQFTTGFKVLEIKKNDFTKAHIIYKQTDANQYHDVIDLNNGNYILGTNNGLFKFNIVTNELLPFCPELNSKKIIALAKINNSILLSVKKETLYALNLRTQKATPITITNPTDNDEIKKYGVEMLYVDKNNFLWLSLWGKGIGYVDLSPMYFKFYFTESDLQNNKIKDRYIVSVKCDSLGNAWLSTKTDGVYCIAKTGAVLSHIPYPDLLKQNPFGDTYIFKGLNQDLFVGCQWGIYKIDKQKKQLVKLSVSYNGSPLKGINDILTTANNTYIISTQTGIFEANANFFEVKNNTVLGDNQVYIRTFIANNKWLFVCKPFTGTKIFKIENNKYTIYDSIKINTSIKHIYVSQDSNTVWLASTIGVIKYQLSNRKYSIINQSELLSNTYTYSVLPDKQGNLWISHNKGITKFDIQKEKSKHYTKSNGLQGNEFNTNAFDKAEDGTMFFGGTNGLNVFDPSAVDSATTAPFLQMVDFKVNDQAFEEKYILSPNDTLVLPYKKNTFSFIPIIVNYYNPEEDECVYKIDGIDKNWLEGRSHNLVRYSNLPAGQYSLLIKDKISDKISTVFIKIKKPYWATTWFILLVVAGITFLTWFIFRNYYLRKLEKHKAELEKQKAVEHERTRIAADMHDDLGSGLTKITYLSQMAINKDNSKEDLQAIKKTSTELVENMSEIIWAMKEENNSLEDLVYYIKVYAMEYCTGNNLNCVIHLPEKLYPRIIAGQSRRNIYLAVKETLHNIVKHAHAQNVTINVGFDKEWKISIKDDGVGINLNAQKIESHHGGNGLNNIKKRIEAVRGRVDIINNNGTEVIFYIPL